jgi:hypothetical protein
MGAGRVHGLPALTYALPSVLCTALSHGTSVPSFWNGLNLRLWTWYREIRVTWNNPVLSEFSVLLIQRKRGVLEYEIQYSSSRIVFKLLRKSQKLIHRPISRCVGSSSFQLIGGNICFEYWVHYYCHGFWIDSLHLTVHCYTYTLVSTVTSSLAVAW